MAESLPSSCLRLQVLVSDSRPPGARMYNGIGLSTVRGSGTNGYVQRNTAHISKGRQEEKFKTEEDIRRLDAQANREPNLGILEHERKRKLEVSSNSLTLSILVLYLSPVSTHYGRL